MSYYNLPSYYDMLSIVGSDYYSGDFLFLPANSSYFIFTLVIFLWMILSFYITNIGQ